MKWKEVPLQYKILFGYFMLITVIGSMIVILLNERKRMREIEIETSKIRGIRQDINAVHRRITILATYGESVITWNDTDYQEYRNRRLVIDSLLQIIKQNCEFFVRPGQIDTLCDLLKDKETHLLYIMKGIRQQEETDSLLVNRLPVTDESAVYTRTSLWKKSNFPGLGNLKKAIGPVSQEKKTPGLNGELITMQVRRMRQIHVYANNLREQNKDLNERLYTFISDLDNQIQNTFKSLEEKTARAQELSYRLLAIIIVITMILSLVSFLIIRYDMKREERRKLQLRQIINENEGLLEMRKKIILTVSHDIRGPLGNIKNCTELALDTREKKRRKTYLDNILYSCQHILHLVNDLMDAYKINEAKENRNDIPFHLDCFLKRISDNYARKANDKALIFESVHESTNVTVKGDADKIEQVLDNLLMNAVKFTLSGSVRFLSEYTDGKLQMEISDTGVGMDEQTLKRIFHPFERASQDINSEGFGLGLFITSGLIRILGGGIQVESVPGKGSLFRVELPLPRTAERVDIEDIPTQYPSVLPKKVLVVDDDTILLKIAEDMFGRNGVECTTCLNAREAVNALRHSDFDLVLTDMQMPVTDGFGLLKLFRNADIGRSRNIPVAVMTARGDGESGIYEKSGFCGCIHKPFSMKELLSFVSSVTMRHSLVNPTFDYARLMEHTDDRPGMLELIIKESGKDLAGLEDALGKMDREAMRKVVHRMLPVWELLSADDMLSGYRAALHDEKVERDMIKEYTSRIMEQIRTLINETQNKLARNCDE